MRTVINKHLNAQPRFMTLGLSLNEFTVLAGIFLVALMFSMLIVMAIQAPLYIPGVIALIPSIIYLIIKQKQFLRDSHYKEVKKNMAKRPKPYIKERQYHA